jgi:SprT-like family
VRRSATKAEAITPAQYRAFQEAYDFFNAELFAGSLPHVLVTLQRNAKARGYFSPDRFTARTEKAAAHELAMNPDSFTGRTDAEILSTLAHEMAHVWQQSHGTPPRRCYHDRQWAEKMKEIGLQASDTGHVGGKETGQSVSHYIIPGGLYAKSYAKLQAKGLQLHWQSAPATGEGEESQQNEIHLPGLWTERMGEAGRTFRLLRCYEETEELVLMLAEPRDEDEAP